MQRYTVEFGAPHRFCSVCGRPPSGQHAIRCAGCTTLFAMGRGEQLYDPQTGKPMLKATDKGRMVQPGYETPRPRRPVPKPRKPLARRAPRKRAPARAAEQSHSSWWVWLLVILAIRGCWSIM